MAWQKDGARTSRARTGSVDAGMARDRLDMPEKIEASAEGRLDGTKERIAGYVVGLVDAAASGFEGFNEVQNIFLSTLQCHA